MVSRPPNAPSLETLPQGVAAIFDQVQTSVANHRKNFVALFKLHSCGTAIGEVTPHGSHRLMGEHRFTSVFLDMLTRVLVLKKGVQPADRVIKFIAGYVKYISEKGARGFI